MYPDATDILLICDGDTWPFEPWLRRAGSHFQSDWCVYRNRHMAIRFHFVAIKSTKADYRNLELMAKDGGGIFALI